MYNRFFGLEQAPFSIAPDPRYLFMSERHREALAHLLYGLDGGGGFVLLTGEIGAGKTTVCRLFLEQIPDNCNVAYIFNPKQTVIELLQSICDEFGIGTPRDARGGATVKDFIDPLNAFLLAEHAQHKNNVLIIDEAQNLSADVLEQLRLLTNLETNQRKLLQIILIGQPELRAMLARPELEQLAQRVIARFHLDALSVDETAQYIAHRLAVAGLTQPSPFGAGVMRRIHELSRGIPRRINLLCDRALLGAYARDQRSVDQRTISIAAGEVFDARASITRRWQVSARQAALVAVLVAGAAAAVTAGLIGNRSGVPAASGSSLTGDGGATNSATNHETNHETNNETNKGTAHADAPHLPVRPAMTTDLKSAARAAKAPSATGSVPTNSMAKTTTAVPAAPAIPAATAIATAPATAPNTATATAAASAPATASASPAADTTRLTDPAARDLPAMIRRLAATWNVRLDDGEPCHAAARQALYCFTGQNGLAEIRQLDRPGVLTLWDDANEKYYALLLGLDRNTAVLQLGDRRETVALTALAKRWRGGFTMLWRGPPDYRKAIAPGDRNDIVDWLAARLAAASGSAMPVPGAPFDATMSARVREFQLAQGLLPDGLPGRKTMMRLASSAGDQGPHLRPAAGMATAAAQAVVTSRPSASASTISEK